MKRTLQLLLAAAVLPASSRLVQAELTSNEVAIIAVQQSEQSREIAEYYAKARGIAPERICYLDIPAHKPLARADWDDTVRPCLREWLTQQQMDSKIRCLVTVWDVPLKIQAHSAEAPVVRERLRYLRADRRRRVGTVNELLNAVAGVLAGKQAKPPEPLPPDADLNTLRQASQQVFQEAQQRVAFAAKTPEGRKADQQLAGLFVANGGLNLLVTNLARQPEATFEKDLPLLKTFESSKARLAGLREGLVGLEALPESVARDQQILALVERTEGLLGALQWIDNHLQALGRNESYSSFDSELSLVEWPNYPLLRWVPNVLHRQFDNTSARQTRPTYLVARLEAPTVDITKRIIDDAIAAEKQGLTGKIYLDARGLGDDENKNNESEKQPPQPGSYEDYDESLRHLAQVLSDHKVEGVVLDNEEALFQPGDCPDAALYCGWYSLARYVDAFDWNPGAVGYHLASSEAVTLRDPNSEVWCKRMLEDGVASTLGPTYEPYLQAFPKPDEFFVLLLSGKFTVAECYWRTCPLNSWVMVFLGDPLYNPYETMPRLSQTSQDPFVQNLLKDPKPAQPAPSM